MTGLSVLDYRSEEILRAIHEAGRPLTSREIAEATGTRSQTVAKHISWRMLYKWLTVKPGNQLSNGYRVRLYELTPRAYARMEDHP